MTPAQVIEESKKGNERFRAGKDGLCDDASQMRASAKGENPAAVILDASIRECPPRSSLMRIGDTFNGRVAGNVVNDDRLGSMESACAVSGAKLVLISEHTSRGAIKGAIDDVVLGNLTGLLPG